MSNSEKVHVYTNELRIIANMVCTDLSLALVKTYSITKDMENDDIKTILNDLCATCPDSQNKEQFVSSMHEIFNL